jgi:hypothetical protein
LHWLCPVAFIYARLRNNRLGGRLDYDQPFASLEA